MPFVRTNLIVVAVAGLTAGLGACIYVPPANTRPDPATTLADSTDSTPMADRDGRISYVEGGVSFRPAAADTWAFAEANAGVTTGDRLWVDTIGRVELQIGANAVRMGVETETQIVDVDDNTFHIGVPQGTVSARVRSFDNADDDELDTPNAAVVISEVGRYRIDVAPDGDLTRVTVRSGLATVTAGGMMFTVHVGQTATIRGVDHPAFDVTAAAAPDDFDDWGSQRDEFEDGMVPSPSSPTPDVSDGTLPH